MFTEYDKFVEFFSYSLSNSLILLIIFIVFGRLFIVNWKNKKEGWQTAKESEDAETKNPKKEAFRG